MFNLRQNMLLTMVEILLIYGCPYKMALMLTSFMPIIVRKSKNNTCLLFFIVAVLYNQARISLLTWHLMKIKPKTKNTNEHKA